MEDDDMQYLFDDGSFVSRNEQGYIEVDWDKFKSLHPTLADAMWQAHCAEVDDAIVNLLDLGLIEVGDINYVDGDIEASYRLTETGKKVLGERE